MKRYKVSPKVAGELGSRTQLASRYPDRVKVAEYLFNIWPSCPLIESFPCFFVRDDLKRAINESGLIGVKFNPCYAGYTDYIEECGRSAIPAFHQMDVIGGPNEDFQLDSSHRLIVSALTKDVMEKWDMADCDYSIVEIK